MHSGLSRHGGEFDLLEDLGGLGGAGAECAAPVVGGCGTQVLYRSSRPDRSREDWPPSAFGRSPIHHSEAPMSDKTHSGGRMPLASALVGSSMPFFPTDRCLVDAEGRV